MSNQKTITQSDFLEIPERAIEALKSVNAVEGTVPHHSKTIRSTQQRIYGINCPCGAGCTFNNDAKAQRMWIKLHKKKCPIGANYQTPNENTTINFVSGHK